MSRPQKLVRDNIPSIIQSRGAKPITRILSEVEYVQELERKLQEEVAEYLSDKNVEELADILEVVYSLGLVLQNTPNQLEELRKKKVSQNGSFKDRIFLDEIQEQ